MIEPSECPRPRGLIEVDRVLDIGAGLRPMGWYKPKEHTVVEPHRRYVDVLLRERYDVIHATALTALVHAKPDEYDAIYMLDVIEHMDRVVGKEVLAAAYHLMPKQIVVFTPMGFLPQTGDAWNMDGDKWQEHRSGWMPRDFPGWEIEMSEPPLHASFLATWTRK